MRVVIAEDSVLLREGLTRLLADAGVEVAAAVGSADELLSAVAEHRPDATVVDVRLPPTFTDEGIRAALVLRRQWPRVAVLVLSQYVEERYAVDLLASDTRGVGYLLEDRVADVREFLDALRRVAGGGRERCRRRSRRRRGPVRGRSRQRRARSSATGPAATENGTRPPDLPPPRSSTSSTVGVSASSMRRMRRYSWSDW